MQNQLLTEEQVLKKLDIEDFRHLTKDKVIKLASMIHKMNPEVAKAAIAQFPNFADAVKDTFSGFRETAANAAKSNDETVRNAYQLFNKEMDILENELANDELSTEVRLEILDRIKELRDSAKELDRENKAFVLKMLAIGAGTAIATVGLLASALGGDSTLSLPGSKDEA